PVQLPGHPQPIQPNHHSDRVHLRHSIKKKSTMKNTFKYIKSISMVFLLGLTIASCGSKNEGTTEEHHEEGENTVELSQAQFEQAGIKIGNVEQRVIGSELRVNGVIDVPPQSNVSINMPYGGFVKY